MKITYSAPAKVIFSGEHAVVYGKPALVSATDLRLSCSVEEITDNKMNDLTGFIYETVCKYLEKKNITYSEKKVKITFSSDIPNGRGLGSSAALSVAAAAACAHVLTGEEQTKETINNIAYLIEKHFHANPSGVDVSASTFGGLIFYRKEFEFLKTISSLNFKLPEKFEKHLYLIDSGKPKESTKEMVELVGKRYNKDSQEIDRALSHIEKITKKMTLSIIQENTNLFKTCLSENEELLETIGVVSPSANTLLKGLNPFGTGKVTGAGGYESGSGYLLFFANNSEELESYLQKKTIKFIKFKQSKEGVMKV